MKKISLLLSALATASAAHANLVVNGGFETGDFTGWTVNPASFPMYIVSAPVHSGAYAAQIAGYSYEPDTLQQTIPTTAGQDYTFSFWRFVAGGAPIESLNVTWDGTTIFSELNPGATLYQEFSFTVQGTGSDTIEFSCANDPAYTYLDDVSLTPVPEPSTYIAGALMLLPLGMGAIRKLLQKQVA